MNLYQNKEWKTVEVNSENIDIPNNWSFEKFKNLFDITSSRRVHAKEYVDSGVPFFRGTEITNLKKGKNKFDTFISQKFFEKLKETNELPKKDDFLITAVGTVGSVLLIKESFDFYFKDGNIIWLKNKNSYCKQYIEYFLNSNYVRKKIYGLGSGTAYNALSIQKFGDSECILPTFNEQESIASILSSQESIIFKTKELIEQLESRNQFMLDELLSGRLRVKDEDGKIYLYKNPNNNWKNININGEDVNIPKDWDKSNIESQAQVHKDKPKNGLKYLEIGDIDILTKKYNILDKEKAGAAAMKFASANTLLISTVRPTRLGFTVTKEDLNVSSAFVKLTSNIQNYLIFLLYTNDFLKFLESNQNGATYPTIKENILINFEFALPGKEEIKNISHVLQNLFSEKEKYNEILIQEEKTFNFLLEELMSGRLRVEA